MTTISITLFFLFEIQGNVTEHGLTRVLDGKDYFSGRVIKGIKGFVRGVNRTGNTR
jgi:hypothetical protein